MPAPGYQQWTTDEDAIIRQGLSDGWSCSMIARNLPYRTRNAIIGRIEREEMRTGMPKTVVKVLAAPKPHIPKPVKIKPPPPPSDEPEPALDATGARYTIATIHNGLCRWPHGDPQRADFHLCGHATANLYCGFHTALAFSTPRKGDSGVMAS